MMQGMIILNEYTEEITKANPLFWGLFGGWLIASIVYWIIRNRTAFAGIALLLEIALLAAMILFSKSILVGERHIVEAYMTPLASMTRIEEKYEIIEQRGKLYILQERADE